MTPSTWWNLVRSACAWASRSKGKRGARGLTAWISQIAEIGPPLGQSGAGCIKIDSQLAVRPACTPKCRACGTDRA